MALAAVRPIRRSAAEPRNSIAGRAPNATAKIHAELNGADHFFPSDNPANQPGSKLQIAWIKRFGDDDTRYDQFLAATGIQLELNNGRLSGALRESTPF